MLILEQVLLACVDPKDPFMQGDIAGEELPGPILSIMGARKFGALHLFYTPHVRHNAAATVEEVHRRYPDCTVAVHELAVSDPKDYSAFVAALARQVRPFISQSGVTKNVVCLSSGTAEMRAAWFILNAIGSLPVKLLQIDSPAQPLFGVPSVEEVELATADWSGLRESCDVIIPDLFTDSALMSVELKHPPLFMRRIVTSRVRAEPENPIPLDEALQELGIVVSSAVLREAAEKAAIAAGTDHPVLILGETGTGKECFARLVHKLSALGKKELVPINCAAIPKEIAESFLFGHVKGAFTGAEANREGVFQKANGTTLFLDEIAELTPEIQAKLLRVIQDGIVQPIGSTTGHRVTVRIIAATNRNLKREVAEGRFREDLYFRLEVIQIRLPALRNRRSEIPGMALSFLQRINQRRQKPRQLSREALQRLEQCEWPGNVRQLLNVLVRSVLYARTDILSPGDLLFEDDGSPSDPLAWLPEPVKGFFIEDYISRIRRHLFNRALDACNGNQSEAAEVLGVSRQAVSQFLARENVNSG